ncbi:MAG: hypothetical protein JNM00_14420 [Flavobacteriales bacterium]|nr:hypothetical protein [Flavobacteriales bacterium]
MKNIAYFLIGAALLVSSLASATIRTVSNHALGGSQYSTLQAAYDASSAGDTLIVEGTITAYTLSGYTKSLVWIGSGLYTQKQNMLQTQFSKASSGAGSASSWYIQSGASGSKFYGINFVGGTNTSNVLSIGTSNIHFENCLFDRKVTVAAGNVVFRNCIFTDINSVTISGSINDIMFSNCIFNYGIIGGGITQSVAFDHCLFLSTGTCFSACDGFEVNNSIFMNSTGVSGITNSAFENNLTRLSMTFPPAGNIDNGGQVIGSDPLFANYVNDALFSSAHDYHLQGGSPALAAATDGTEIGLHGGYTNFSETGEVLIVPVVRSMNVPNSNAPVGGIINVEVSASKPTDN